MWYLIAIMFEIRPEIYVAIIAFMGVIMSVLISYISGRKALRHEIEKLKSSIEQGFSSKILDERQKRYPEIYNAISELCKYIKVQQDGYSIPEKEVTRDLLFDAFSKLEKFDSNHGLFYSIQTAYHMAHLRDEIYKAISTLNKDARLLSKQSLNEIRTAASLAEVGLKKDIGILIDEFQSIRKEYDSKNDYMDLAKE